MCAGHDVARLLSGAFNRDTRPGGLTVLALVLPAPGRRSATSAKTGPEKVMAGVAPSSAVEDGIGPAGT